jgi:hypothetical protein
MRRVLMVASGLPDGVRLLCKGVRADMVERVRVARLGQLSP